MRVTGRCGCSKGRSVPPLIQDEYQAGVAAQQVRALVTKPHGLRIPRSCVVKGENQLRKSSPTFHMHVKAHGSHTLHQI